MSLEKDLNELNESVSDLKSQTIERFVAWFWGLKYAQAIYIALYVIAGAYVLTSFYLTFN